jgi:hypothetical protein
LVRTSLDVIGVMARPRSRKPEVKAPPSGKLIFLWTAPGRIGDAYSIFVNMFLGGGFEFQVFHCFSLFFNA